MEYKGIRDLPDLPLEETAEARLTRVEDLIFTFRTVDKAEIKSGDAKGRSFNDKNLALIREDTPVDSVKEMVKKINVYDYEGSMPGKCKGYLFLGLSLGCYYWCRRKTVKEGFLGHYRSSGRRMVVEPGFHALIATTDVWERDIQVDGNGYINHKIDVGSKTIVYVPENHLGGAYRIADDEGEDEGNQVDGQYVLFPNGRYVIESCAYRRVEVISLEMEVGVKFKHLGPLTIVHIKEGWLGGAFRVQTGKYEILNPGPPYILHAKDYQEISVEKREDLFYLGPLIFLTVRDGTLAGAYHRQTGKYHIFPPGNTYKLHTKDYYFEEARDRKDRSTQFRLGPYNFVTVREGFVAGAYKRRGGEWIMLPQGNSYQLSWDDFEQPILVQLKQSYNRCGPLTYLTVPEDKLAGAWRVNDGKFVSFDDNNRLYTLSEQEYHTLQFINKYSTLPQEFGPSKVVTVPDGYYGVFEKEGVIEIMEPGWYTRSFEYLFRQNIPANVKSFTLKDKRFLTKDGVEMLINCTMNWRVSPNFVRQCAVYVQSGTNGGGFKTLEASMQTLFNVMIVKYCKMYTRAMLLPTKQEIVLAAGLDADSNVISELLEKQKNKTAALYRGIEKEIQEDMQKDIENSGWGVELTNIVDPDTGDVSPSGVKLEGFSISTSDHVSSQILKNLEEITVALLQASKERIEGELDIEKAEIDKLIKIKKIATNTFVQKAIARADAETKKIETNSRVNCLKVKAKAQAEAGIIEREAQNKVTILEQSTEAEAEAAGRKVILEIVTQEILERAKTQASATDLVSEAEFIRKKKQNQAAEKMSEKQFQLMKADIAVEALKHFGAAKWRMPSDVLQFYESFSPYLRMGPITAEELLGEMKVK